MLFATKFPPEHESQLRYLVSKHEVYNKEWPAMVEQRVRYADLPVKLIDVLHATLALNPADEGQKLAQREMIDELQNALDARRQRILLSR